MDRAVVAPLVHDNQAAIGWSGAKIPYALMDVALVVRHASQIVLDVRRQSGLDLQHAPMLVLNVALQPIRVSSLGPLGCKEGLADSGLLFAVAQDGLDLLIGAALGLFGQVLLMLDILDEFWCFGRQMLEQGSLGCDLVLESLNAVWIGDGSGHGLLEKLFILTDLILDLADKVGVIECVIHLF